MGGTGNQHGAPSGRAIAIAKRLLVVAIAALCLWAIYQALHGQSPADILAALRATPPATLALAAALVGATHLVMWGMELLALRDAGVRVSLARAGLSSFIGNSLSIVAGLGPISGAGVRAGLYARWGVPAYAAAVVGMGVTIMSLTGGAVLAAVGLVLQPGNVAAMVGVPAALARGFGVAFLALVALGLALIGPSRMAVSLFKVRLSLPSAGGALLRISLGALDWWISANVFYVLVSAANAVAPLSFATAFASAHFAGMAVGAPAGIGVFDAIFLQLGQADKTSAVAAALLFYRLVGYAAPALLALGPYLWFTHARQPPAPAPAEGARAASLRELIGQGPLFVLAPHPDDESIGCGALIAACARARTPVFIHFLTDGRNSHPGAAAWPPERIALEREREAERAARRLGLDKSALTFERATDGTLLFDWSAAERLAHSIAARAKSFPAPVILAPWRGDPHPDHMAAAVIADLVEQAHGRARGLRYLVWANDQAQAPAWGANEALRFSTLRWRRAKQRAIYEHRTQTSDLISADAPRPTPDLARAIAGDEIYLVARS